MSESNANGDIPSNFYVVRHPLMAHLISVARDQRTQTSRFRLVLRQAGILLAYEATRDLPSETVSIQTPLEACDCEQLTRPVTIVAILRAGIGMTDGMMSLLPEARVGHLGMYRDEEKLSPVSYYENLPPNIERCPTLLVDPMLATGGSASAAATRLRERGAHDLRFICLVAAPEGVNRLASDHPDMPIYAAALDRQLNASGYILPGLGDAGDRLFGTQ